MTATVHVLHEQATPPLPLLPERRKLLLDWVATEIHHDRFVPDEIQEALLDAFASPDLTAEQRAEFWDGALHWVGLREDAIERIGHPEDVLMRPGTADEAQQAATEVASGELSLVVHGNQAARGRRGNTGEIA